MTVAPPETGRLVEVRGRQCVATDVPSSGLADAKESAPQHLMTLAAHALGESVSMLWEIEPGARVLDPVGLPPSMVGHRAVGSKPFFCCTLGNKNSRITFLINANLTLRRPLPRTGSGSASKRR